MVFGRVSTVSAARLLTGVLLAAVRMLRTIEFCARASALFFAHAAAAVLAASVLPTLA